LKLKGGDIAICKAVISAKYRDQYQALYDRQFARVESKRKSDKRISDSVLCTESLGNAQAAMGKWST
jgi:hypothetical protein